MIMDQLRENFKRLRAENDYRNKEVIYYKKLIHEYLKIYLPDKKIYNHECLTFEFSEQHDSIGGVFIPENGDSEMYVISLKYFHQFTILKERRIKLERIKNRINRKKRFSFIKNIFLK
jgi:hypothetical protein